MAYAQVQPKVAYCYFVCAMALFLAQVLFGVLAGTVYVWPNFLSELLPFHILRMIHTNALIVWLLLGFLGATYYLLPEEAEREIHSPLWPTLQLWMSSSPPLRSRSSATCSASTRAASSWSSPRPSSSRSSSPC